MMVVFLAFVADSGCEFSRNESEHMRTRIVNVVNTFQPRQRRNGN